MTRLSASAFPWDILGDPDAVPALAEAGLDSVTLAANYHAVQAATPRHPAHRVVTAPRSALYVPVRDEAWRGREIVPSGASWAGENAFGRAASALAEGGVPVEAWIVLTHDDGRPGGGRFSVVSAFGDVLPFALCPSRPAVVAYAVTLVEEVLRSSAASAVVLESVGPLGLGHDSGHDKTAGADWSALDQALLSICCCSSCAGLYADLDVDPDELARRIRAAVGSSHLTTDGEVEALAEALGDSTARAVLQVRSQTTRALFDATASAARAAGAERVAVHSTPDEWTTGSFAAVMSREADVDAWILSESRASALSPAEATTLRERFPDQRLGAWISAMPPAEPTALQQRWAALAAAGVEQFTLYNWGLLSRKRLAAGLAALEALR